jgi:hypothetical protein
MTPNQALHLAQRACKAFWRSSFPAPAGQVSLGVMLAGDHVYKA